MGNKYPLLSYMSVSLDCCLYLCAHPLRITWVCMWRWGAQQLKYNIERSEDRGVSWSIIAVGTTLAIFGFAIYYLLPLSLLR